MVPNASEDFPEPETPVNTTSASRGIATSTLRRLCSLAPRTRTNGSDTSTDTTAGYPTCPAGRPSGPAAVSGGPGPDDGPPVRERPAPLVTDGGDVRVVPVTPGKSGRDRHVPVAGGRGDLHDMAVPRSGAGPPPRRLLDVVAGLTGALEVLPAGGPTLREGDDVVVVPDRRSAPRGAAALVPGVDEAGE